MTCPLSIAVLASSSSAWGAGSGFDGGTLVGLITCVLGVGIGYYLRGLVGRWQAEAIEKQAQAKLDSADGEVRSKLKEAEIQARAEVVKAREEFENTTKARRKELQDFESRLIERDGNLDRKAAMLDKKEEHAKVLIADSETKAEAAKTRRAENEEKAAQLQQRFQKLAGMTAEEARREMTRLREEAEVQRKRLAESRETALRKAKEDARRVLEKARSESEAILSELRRIKREGGDSRENDARRLKERLTRGLDEMRDGLAQPAERAAEPPKSLKAGDTVRMTSLGAEAAVLSAPDARGEVQLQAGVMKMKAHISQLELIREKPLKETARVRGMVDMANRTVSQEIDLRGMALGESIDEVDKFLDDAVLSALNVVHIIHGKGTGALRSGIHLHLKKHPHVKSYRLGKYGEGEEGVTVVTLK
ncbi:MAG: Rnase Y domain-containing protein [Kiritimatiellaeota bacterium]|nr:Rnase Y domain-containing protein [Kiritimatiellota bacterium]